MQGETASEPRALGLCPDRLERIDGWMRANVAAGKVAGLSVMLARGGKTAFFRTHGRADIARDKPFAPDTIARIYSMTKPLTSVAVMMLYAEGRFQLDDPITRFLPEFSDLRVLTGGNRAKFESEPARRPITIRDLLTHTSGLTYGFMEATLVDALYRQNGVDFGEAQDAGLAEVVGRLARQPLLAQPGAEWNYSVATDVLGYLVEKISGQPFDAFLKSRIFDPLNMVDTSFFVPESQRARFTACYALTPTGKIVLQDDPEKSRYLNDPSVKSGGGGLVSTADDYMRFCRMLLNGGELDGARLLSPKTIRLMTINHLPGGKELTELSKSLFSEAVFEGLGFGLGFAMTVDQARTKNIGSHGEYFWGGMASTAFWIDPVEDLAVVFMTQLMPSTAYPIRRELRTLVYSAFTESAA